MTRRFFGTDGVRGTANTHPMTAEIALRLGAAAGRYFRSDGRNGHRVVIGKDTRLSGYMLENALTAGLTSTGMNVLLLGPVPTPGVGFLTRSMRADLGIMISASHNPAHDNGIKFFGPDGFKLDDAAELAIEAMLDGDIPLVAPDQIGRAKRIDDGLGRYVEYAKTTFPGRGQLAGLKVQGQDLVTKGLVGQFEAHPSDTPSSAFIRHAPPAFFPLSIRRHGHHVDMKYF